MQPIISLFWNLCLLRSGPEQVPTVGVFVGLVLIVNVLVSTLVALSAPAELSLLQAVSIPVVAATVLAAGTLLMLSLKNLSHRFTATITALLGADIVITTLHLPLLLVAEPSGEPPFSVLEWLLILAQLALIFWWVTIAGFIFSRALTVPMPQGVALAVFVILASFMVTNAVVPLPAAQP